MSEPLIPVPGAERDSSWDPLPPRCPECRTIIDLPFGEYRGRCPEHGIVTVVYGDSPNSENDVAV